MKLIYRLLILISIFAGSLYFFGKNITENVFRIEKKEMTMGEAELPYISFIVNDEEMNRLHGYCPNLDEMLLRESITPLTEEQNFTVAITENEYIVKKLTYELTDIVTGQIVETGSVTALDKEADKKTAGVRLKEPLEQDTEYAAKITLITNQSKRIYFYTRIKVVKNSYLSEKLDFVSAFHDKTLDKSKASEIRQYLEPKGNSDNSTFAKVTINSSPNMVSWGDLEPVVLAQEVPMITEYGADTASIVLNYHVSVKTDVGLEWYKVKECYRFKYTSSRVYLYNFERTMEAYFDPSLISLTKSEFKIGITNDTELSIVPNKSNNIFAFVRGRELWTYVAKENEMIQVFSFRQENTDYFRDTFEQHNVRILNLDDAGNIDFIVYGYMNRGEYEGRVGIVLYHYSYFTKSIEEQVYIPVNTTYQMLEQELGSFAYRSTNSVFYFSIFDTLYSYNFVSKALTVLSEGISEDMLAFSAADGYVAWQETEEAAQRINVLLLEEGKRQTIEAGANEYIRILGKIDENIVYGLVKKEAVSTDRLGYTIYPMYSIRISDKTGVVLKDYVMDDYVTESVEITDNVITLNRLAKDSSTFSKYVGAPQDYILNQAGLNSSPYHLAKRVGDKMLTEYYISLPEYYEIITMPKAFVTKNTVIMEDTTVRVTKQDTYDNRYFAYSFGELILCSENAGNAVRAADEAVGTVIDSNGRLIWQRGAKPLKAEITTITPVTQYGSLDSLQACLKMIFQYKNVEVEVGAISREEKSIAEWMKQFIKVEPLNLSGATLDEVLYMVGKGRPVLTMKGEFSSVLITGYDSTSITLIDPSTGRSTKMGLKEAEELFTKAGSLYISYYE